MNEEMKTKYTFTKSVFMCHGEGSNSQCLVWQNKQQLWEYTF